MTESRFLRSEVDRVRPLLQQSLPWTPHDFIRNISLRGDRELQAAHLLRPIDPADDLRLLVPIPGDELAVCAERLPWDSAFFGYDVARLHGMFPLSNGFAPRAEYAPAVRGLLELAQSRGIKFLFSVVDARDLPTMRALTTAGFALLETRCVFHRSVFDYQFPRRYRCRLATVDDVESLSAVARTDENPLDRFRADPFITKEQADRLMVTWIRVSVLDGFADATIVPDRTDPAALCTLKYHRDKWPAWSTSIAQVMFALASRRANGWAMRILSELNYHLKELGVEHVFFTTQVANRPASRISEHLGFRLGRCEHVMRRVL